MKKIKESEGIKADKTKKDKEIICKKTRKK